MESFVLTHVEKLANDIKAMQADTAATDSLYALLKQKQAALEPLLCSSPDNTAKLTEFIHRYIESVPSYLQAFQQLAETSCIESYTTPFINAATECFLENHPIIDQLSGAHAYLCRAYLCHRMLEELNDRVRTERAWPLAPSDNTYVNIIVHTIIGDKEANELDQTVLVRLELINTTLTDQEKSAFISNKAVSVLSALRQQGWHEILQEWPILGEDLAEVLDPL